MIPTPTAGSFIQSFSAHVNNFDSSTCCRTPAERWNANSASHSAPLDVYILPLACGTFATTSLNGGYLNLLLRILTGLFVSSESFWRNVEWNICVTSFFWRLLVIRPGFRSSSLRQEDTRAHSWLNVSGPWDKPGRL